MYPHGRLHRARDHLHRRRPTPVEDALGGPARPRGRPGRGRREGPGRAEREEAGPAGRRRRRLGGPGGTAEDDGGDGALKVGIEEAGAAVQLRDEDLAVAGGGGRGGQLKGNIIRSRNFAFAISNESNYTFL